MYLEYYGLNRNPFQITLDSDLVYLSQSHARAKAYMSYSIWKWDGLSVVTGKPGTGKTLLAKNLISRLNDDVTSVYLNHTRLSTKEFLRSLAANLGIPQFEAQKASLIFSISQYLKRQSAAGKKVLLVIDEAHHLSKDTLEEIRFFTALENNSSPLLNVILVGDDSLLTTFDDPGLTQLRQRVRLWYSLKTFDKQNVKEYVNFRLAMSGRDQHGIFSDAAISIIFEFSSGIPRLINVLCDSAMVAAYVKEDSVVNSSHVRTALEELEWDKFAGKLMLQRETSRPSKKLIKKDKKKFYPKLKISNQGKSMADMVLNKDSVTIGSDKSNDFVFEDNTVEDQHAIINKIRNDFVIEDLDSRNGTYINGKRIKSHFLKEGDLIGISSYEIVFKRPEEELNIENNNSKRIPFGGHFENDHKLPNSGRLAG